MGQLASCIQHAVTHIQLILRAFQGKDNVVSTVICLTTIFYKSVFHREKQARLIVETTFTHSLKKWASDFSSLFDCWTFSIWLGSSACYQNHSFSLKMQVDYVCLQSITVEKVNLVIFIVCVTTTVISNAWNLRTVLRREENEGKKKGKKSEIIFL